MRTLPNVTSAAGFSDRLAAKMSFSLLSLCGGLEKFRSFLSLCFVLFCSVLFYLVLGTVLAF